MQHLLRPICASLLLAGSSAAIATNGMNMEGYGPVAAAMGGAAMGYENGTAALMNNPATLALMADGTRIDLAIGALGPQVKANGQESSGTSYVMPAFGIAHKQNDLVFGFGIFAQGGMGTEYSNSGFYGGLADMLGAPLAANNPGRGMTNRSEIGVGRALLPIAWKATERLTVGGSIDYVWATMDLQMLIDGAHFGDMLTGMGGSGRFGNASGSLTAALGGLGTVNWGYFNFSDDNKFSGAAKGYGWAGKVGFSYKVSPELTAGAVYHSKTALSDLTANSAQMIMSGTAMTLPVSGKIKVSNFQWPEMYGFGVSYTPDDRWQLVADYRRIGWKAVMKQFSMTFESAMGVLDMTMRQDWKDQDVIMLGAAYKFTPQLTLRGGVNLANNPVPNDVTNPLFPAIVKNHLTGGFGYAFSPKSSFDLSATYAPKAKVQSNFSNSEITHGQYNAQLMYSMFF